MAVRGAAPAVGPREAEPWTRLNMTAPCRTPGARPSAALSGRSGCGRRARATRRHGAGAGRDSGHLVRARRPQQQRARDQRRAGRGGARGVARQPRRPPLPLPRGAGRRQLGGHGDGAKRSAGYATQTVALAPDAPDALGER